MTGDEMTDDYMTGAEGILADHRGPFDFAQGRLRESQGSSTNRTPIAASTLPHFALCDWDMEINSAASVVDQRTVVDQIRSGRRTSSAPAQIPPGSRAKRKLCLRRYSERRGPEVLFEEIAIDLPQARFWITSELPTTQELANR
jgi:hypothetical protein